MILLGKLLILNKVEKNSYLALKECYFGVRLEGKGLNLPFPSIKFFPFNKILSFTLELLNVRLMFYGYKYTYFCFETK